MVNHISQDRISNDMIQYAPHAIVVLFYGCKGREQSNEWDGTGRTY